MVRALDARQSCQSKVARKVAKVARAAMTAGRGVRPQTELPRYEMHRQPPS